jgi:hypothetical protein
VTRLGRAKRSEQLSVSVSLSEFSIDALATAGGKDSESVGAQLVRAVRFYLSDRGSKQPGWPYPDALRERPPVAVGLDVVVDEDAWTRLEEEAKTQDVSVSQLAGHAALYYAAELDAGRITQRILEGAGESEPDAGSG